MDGWSTFDSLDSSVETLHDIYAPLASLTSFLAVLRWPGRTCAELGRMDGISQQTANRPLLTLRAANPPLVTTYDDRDGTKYVATDHGRELLARIIEEMSDVGTLA
jgi:hypothetical protein